jgi:hypothetical protein
MTADTVTFNLPIIPGRVVHRATFTRRWFGYRSVEIVWEAERHD